MPDRLMLIMGDRPARRVATHAICRQPAARARLTPVNPVFRRLAGVTTLRLDGIKLQLATERAIVAVLHGIIDERRTVQLPRLGTTRKLGPIALGYRLGGIGTLRRILIGQLRGRVRTT